MVIVGELMNVLRERDETSPSSLSLTRSALESTRQFTTTARKATPPASRALLALSIARFSPSSLDFHFSTVTFEVRRRLDDCLVGTMATGL